MIRLHFYARERLHARGATEEEVIATVKNGEVNIILLNRLKLQS